MFLTVGAVARVFFQAAVYSVVGGLITALYRLVKPLPFDAGLPIIWRARDGSHFGLWSGLAVGAFVATLATFNERRPAIAHILAGALGGFFAFTALQGLFFTYYTPTRPVAVAGLVLGALAGAMAKGHRPDVASPSPKAG